MPVMTAKDKDTGKTVKFNWKGEGQPTPDDLHGIFTDAQTWKGTSAVTGQSLEPERVSHTQGNEGILPRIGKPIIAASEAVKGEVDRYMTNPVKATKEDNQSLVSQYIRDDGNIDPTLVTKEAITGLNPVLGSVKLYHGSVAGLKKLERKFSGIVSGIKQEHAIWLTRSEDDAKWFAEMAIHGTKNKPKIYEVAFTPQKPLVIEFKDWWDTSALKSNPNKKKWIEYAEKNNNDSVIFKDLHGKDEVAVLKDSIDLYGSAPVPMQKKEDKQDGTVIPNKGLRDTMLESQRYITKQGNQVIDKGLSMAKEAAPLFFPDEMKKIAKLDPWQRQLYVLQKIDAGGATMLIQPLQVAGVPETLISKIWSMKQQGMKFGDIIKNLSGDEAKMAMDAIAPPSLVQHEVQRITPSLGGLR